MKIKYIYILLLGFISLISCEKENIDATSILPLNAYDTLTLNSVFDVELIQDTVNAIEISGTARSIEKILIEQENGHLKLTNTYKGNFLHPSKNKIQIKLHTDGIRLIKANETCYIHSSIPLTGEEIGLVMASKLNEANLVLNCGSFYYWNNFPCGGKITLSGETNDLKLWNVALMTVDAQALTCKTALVENASKGDCKVTCLEQLTCALRGEGNIYLWGNPPNITVIEQSSEGQLIKQ
jgi:hypothetical protein